MCCRRKKWMLQCDCEKRTGEECFLILAGLWREQGKGNFRVSGSAVQKGETGLYCLPCSWTIEQLAGRKMLWPSATMDWLSVEGYISNHLLIMWNACLHLPPFCDFWSSVIFISLKWALWVESLRPITTVCMHRDCISLGVVSFIPFFLVSLTCEKQPLPPANEGCISVFWI